MANQPKNPPKSDESEPVPDDERSPGERVAREVREAIESDALLERKGETGR